MYREEHKWFEFRFAFLLLVHRWKLQGLRGHKVVAVISYLIFTVNTCSESFIHCKFLGRTKRLLYLAIHRQKFKGCSSESGMQLSKLMII